MTVADVDRLVLQNDAAAAKLWPRLGPKVREAYLEDRDAWVVLRRRADEGRPPTPEALATKHRAFTGWARAFRAASTRRTRPKHAPTAARPTATAPTPSAAPPAALASPPTNALPATVAPGPGPIAKSASGGGAAVAGGLVLAGLIALAARRKRP